MNKRFVFFDMDGVVADYPASSTEHDMQQKGYFLNRKPEWNVVLALKELVSKYKNNDNVDFFILTKTFPDFFIYSVEEKEEWRKRFIPFIDLDHFIMVDGSKMEKTDAIRAHGIEIDRNCFLIDDYNPNLADWASKGGTPIKYNNGINDKRQTFEGERLFYTQSPKDIVFNLERITHINPLLCIVGRSGSGKTTIADYLEKEYGLRNVWSYTTRAPRSENERGHTFRTIDDYRNTPEEEKIAEVFYNNNYYWVTKSFLDEHDVYVLDPKGLAELRTKYSKTRPMFVVELVIDENVASERMIGRGDDAEAVRNRIKLDRGIFFNGDIKADLVIDTTEGNVEIFANKILEAYRAKNNC